MCAQFILPRFTNQMSLHLPWKRGNREVKRVRSYNLVLLTEVGRGLGEWSGGIEQNNNNNSKGNKLMDMDNSVVCWKRGMWRGKGGHGGINGDAQRLDLGR